jgi:phage shock protein PspC (stress-responsive transcriptional regulator)
MNEVTQIHLGRQAFTIAADAHKVLRKYLDAIQQEVHDSDVVEEVELRMSELLAERGIVGDKVILLKDVEFLKAQLGEPKDFNEETEGQAPPKSSETKRLFRDTDNAMIAGVAAGLANYFGIDVLLIRLIFVIAVVTGGWGILLYIALWLLVPEATTSSERLQMAGRPVTIDSLREVASRADFSAAAARANKTLAGPINSVFRTVLKIIGISTIIVGLALLFALLTAGSYVLLHTGNLFGQDIFPVGFREHLLLSSGVAVTALLAILIIVFGMAIFKQKWPIKNWITGTLIGFIIIGLAGTAGLGADSAPRVRDRYNAHFHSTTRSLQPFTSIDVNGTNEVAVRFQHADSYFVEMNYYDHPDVSAIKTTVTDNKLVVDMSRFDNLRHCASFCLPDNYAMRITVYSPTQPDVPPLPDRPIKPFEL